jgi:dipeptidyl aminopeptidase/acylaminoacyl peptidase
MKFRSIAVLIGWLALCPPLASHLGAQDVDETVSLMAKIGAAWSPSFSPAGDKLAFVSDLNGVPQVWVVDSRGGWPQLVTGLDDQVGGVSWSPGGEWLAFSLAPGGGMNAQVYLVRPDGTDLRRLTDGGEENNWLGDWSHDGRLLVLSSNRGGSVSMDAYAYDLRAEALRKIAANPGIGAVTNLSRDGRRAVLWRMESRSDDNLFLLDLQDGAESLLTPHEGPGSFGGGRFSPDGSTIYLSANAGLDLSGFARLTVGAGGTVGPVEYLAAREDAELSDFALTDDGATAALIWNVAGRSELQFLDLASLALRPGPELPAEIAGAAVFSRDGRRLAMTLSGSAAPTDIWVLDRDAGTLSQITHSPHAGVRLDALIRPELVYFAAADGLRLSGWLYRPDGAGGPAPYVISFHGGPEGQERPRFRSDYQALLAAGIGVFAPNVRGSAGFGKRFVNLDNGALRYGAIEDIEACAAYLVDNRIADPDRIGIMGGSYGGYMTMAGLAWYPELFAAGANLFGVVNFETFFRDTEPWMAAISTVEYGDPESEAELLRDLSPIHRVDRVRAPTIVLHGANDTNVPVVEAEQVVASLERRGVPVRYVLFPDEGHGFRKTENRITATTEIVRWFDAYLNRSGEGKGEGKGR